MGRKRQNYLLSRASAIDDVCFDACVTELPAEEERHSAQTLCLATCFQNVVRGFELMTKYEKTLGLGRV